MVKRDGEGEVAGTRQEIARVCDCQCTCNSNHLVCIVSHAGALESKSHRDNNYTPFYTSLGAGPLPSSQSALEVHLHEQRPIKLGTSGPEIYFLEMGITGRQDCRNFALLSDAQV